MSINKRDHSSHKTRAGKKERYTHPGLNALGPTLVTHQGFAEKEADTITREL